MPVAGLWMTALAVGLSLPACLAEMATAVGPPDIEAAATAVLSRRCLSCHGPAVRQGGVRLDRRSGLLAERNGTPIVVPGDLEKGLLLAAVARRGAHPMPPSGPLPAAEIAVLRRWILAGAALAGSAEPPHWSFQRLGRPSPPRVGNRSWPRNDVDRFILARLEKQAFQPNRSADRRVLLRRVTFDLTGLPPTPEETAAFLSDQRADAWGRVVDRLLASPRYGERWGRHWLDVARYADTHGYDKDKRRDNAWPYRDYVIRAFNEDRPFGRFAQEQIAGDILFPTDPQATIATGFLAAGPWDFVGHVELREGTVEKEKTRVLDRDDMVSGVMGAFASVTVHCARCHDHKFDPIPQREYYRLQAVFAGVERGDRQLSDVDAVGRRSRSESKLVELRARRSAWLMEAGGPEAREVERARIEAAAVLARTPAPPALDGSSSNGYHSAIFATGAESPWVQVDLGRELPVDFVRLIPAYPTDFRPAPGFGFPLRYRVELSGDPGFLDPTVVEEHSRQDRPNPGERPVVISAGGVRARYVRVTATRLWERTADYVFALAELQALSGGRNVAAGASVTARDSIEAGRWGTRYLVDGQDSRRRYPPEQDPDGSILARRVAAETAAARAEAAAAVLEQRLSASPRALELRGIDAAIGAEVRALAEVSVTRPVYGIVSRTPRPIYLLHRGEVEQPREQVSPGALSCVQGLSPEFVASSAAGSPEGRGRAALADWIADPRNPLTWRSVVNRVWHYHFGRGLVDTPNDFGRQGSAPSHPELLDWLARWFLDHGQSLKSLHRLILNSATYQQASSGGDPRAARLDAENRLLWRGSRRRLDAEEMRDAVLAVGGRLDLRMGGPGYDLFRFKDDHSPVYDHTDPAQTLNPATWRRTVYRFVVRSVPNPFLDSLDCPDPNQSVPVRNKTLTALQALALLNDPFILRQASCLAERLTAAAADVGGQVGLAFRLALNREPSPTERADWAAYVREAGWPSAARVLFNLNEFAFID